MQLMRREFDGLPGFVRKKQMQLPADDGVIEIDGEISDKPTTLVQQASQEHDLTVAKSLSHMLRIEEFTFPLPVESQDSETIISYHHMPPLDGCPVRVGSIEHRRIASLVETLPNITDHCTQQTCFMATFHFDCAPDRTRRRLECVVWWLSQRIPLAAHSVRIF